MGKTPVVNYGQNIKYDVPYEYMTDANDCWVVTLKMLLTFVGKPFDESGVSDERKKFGVGDADLGAVLSPYLKRFEGELRTGDDIFNLLSKHGPALVVLNEGERIQHAQILTGRIDDQVFLNNPDNNFVTAELGASGPFLRIEESIKRRYGGLTFKEWQSWVADAARDSTQAHAANESPPPGSPQLSPRSAGPATPPRSAPSSPQLSPRSTGLPGAITPPGSAPGSPRLSPPAALGAPITPPGSAPGSPQLPRRGSLSTSSAPGGESHSPPANSGPALPSLELVALRAHLERAMPNAGVDEKRRYIQEMEAKCQFRQHRAMPVRTFLDRLIQKLSVWTLRDW
jgi:hypothetical protein